MRLLPEKNAPWRQETDMSVCELNKVKAFGGRIQVGEICKEYNRLFLPTVNICLLYVYHSFWDLDTKVPLQQLTKRYFKDFALASWATFWNSNLFSKLCQFAQINVFFYAVVIKTSISDVRFVYSCSSKLVELVNKNCGTISHFPVSMPLSCITVRRGAVKLYYFDMVSFYTMRSSLIPKYIITFLHFFLSLSCEEASLFPPG